MGFWEIIDAWLSQADNRKVVIHRLSNKTLVSLFWRGKCVRKYTKEETERITKAGKTKPKKKKSRK